MRRTLYYLSVLWVTAAFAYAIYERFAEVGLFARLLGWQLETFGSAPLMLTTLVAGIIYGSPGIITMSFTRSAKRPPDPVAGQRNAAIVFLLVAVICILAGVAGYVIYTAHAARQSATVAPAAAPAPRLVSVDLDAAAGFPNAERADGVAVTGWLRRDAQYALEEKGYGGKKTVFCPFVNGRWNASEPVRVFLRADPSAPIALSRAGGPPPAGMKLPKGFVAVDFAPPTPVQVTIEGTTRPGGLPDYAVSFFKKEGVKPAGDYVVLDAKPFFDTPGRSEWEKFAETSYLLTYLAVPLGLVFGLLSVVSLVRWRKLLAQRQAEQPRVAGWGD